MYTQDDVRAFIRKEPFRPFSIHMDDGQSFEVLHPRLTLVFPNYVVVGIPEQGESAPIFDYAVTCFFERIQSIESVER